MEHAIPYPSVLHKPCCFCGERNTYVQFVMMPPGSSWYDSKYVVKTMKHPDSVMVYHAFSGNNGIGDLYLLFKNNYFDVLEHQILPFWDIHQYHHFMHDGAPAPNSKLVKKFLESKKIQWSGQTMLPI